MKNLYETRATASGGRNGQVATDDGLLSVKLAYPKALGGKGDQTNPEQLFAAGYAACFSNAILHVAKAFSVTLTQAPVSATIGLAANASGGFQLSASLKVALADIELATAQKLVEAAHQVCPYSNAIRNNVAVKLEVIQA
ncbi:MAG: organic hydroperoxide resistance protein [Hahellaceae bacterium]|nr:organic hydroperoxide resistance protein [Hahellaceae bacterium]